MLESRLNLIICFLFLFLRIQRKHKKKKKKKTKFGAFIRKIGNLCRGNKDINDEEKEKEKKEIQQEIFTNIDPALVKRMIKYHGHGLMITVYIKCDFGSFPMKISLCDTLQTLLLLKIEKFTAYWLEKDLFDFRIEYKNKLLTQNGNIKLWHINMDHGDTLKLVLNGKGGGGPPPIRPEWFNFGAVAFIGQAIRDTFPDLTVTERIALKTEIINKGIFGEYGLNLLILGDR